MKIKRREKTTRILTHDILYTFESELNNTHRQARRHTHARTRTLTYNTIHSFSRNCFYSTHIFISLELHTHTFRVYKYINTRIITLRKLKDTDAHRDMGISKDALTY